MADRRDSGAWREPDRLHPGRPARSRRPVTERTGQAHRGLSVASFIPPGTPPRSVATIHRPAVRPGTDRPATRRTTDFTRHAERVSAKFSTACTQALTWGFGKTDQDYPQVVHSVGGTCDWLPPFIPRLSTEGSPGGIALRLTGVLASPPDRVRTVASAGRTARRSEGKRSHGRSSNRSRPAARATGCERGAPNGQVRHNRTGVRTRRRCPGRWR